MESILIVDDDVTFRTRLLKAMRARGLVAYGAENSQEAKRIAREQQPDCAVFDLRLAAENGLELLRDFREEFSQTKVLMLTGYGSIATALEAVRLGATNYLTKPAEVEEILSAFQGQDGLSLTATPTSAIPTPSLARAEWEHMQRVLADSDGNISHAAKRLGLPRRTLQRKLLKIPPRD